MVRLGMSAEFSLLPSRTFLIIGPAFSTLELASRITHSKRSGDYG